MRFPSFLTATLLAAALTGATPAIAASDTGAPIQVENPWTRATPPAARAGGGFVTIRNAGSEPDRLVGGRSPLGIVEIHTMDMDKATGVMRMRPLPDGIALPAGATVELKPGGDHLMFLDLKAPIAQGAPVPVVLIFEKAGELPVELQVAPMGAKGAAGGHGGGQGKH